MVDMAKMKEQAMQRKREHDEKELRKQLGSSRRPAPRRSSRAAPKSSSSRRGQPAPAAAPRAKPKKAKRSISRWALDILLFLGTLLALIVWLVPF